jgi:DNA polymerase/3'-5' exonuclease PolX
LYNGFQPKKVAEDWLEGFIEELDEMKEGELRFFPRKACAF